MGLRRLLLGDPKCTRCSRAKCICRNVERGHVKAARRGKIDPRPRPCPNPGCGRTVRGGICPGPDC